MGYRALHQCIGRHLLGSGRKCCPKFFEIIVPLSLVPGTPWTTGSGWTNHSSWKFLRGLDRSTLTTTRTFMMSTRQQTSSSDFHAWAQKLVSASIGTMEANCNFLATYSAVNLGTQYKSIFFSFNLMSKARMFSLISSPLFSVPKRKSTSNQPYLLFHEILHLREPLVGSLAFYFILILNRESTS